MTERPLAGGSNARIRATRSGAREIESHRPPYPLSTSKGSYSNVREEERNRNRKYPPDGLTTSSRYRRSGDTRTTTRSRHLLRPLKARERYTSASRTWLASLFAACLACINYRRGSDTAALQDAILYERDWEFSRSLRVHLSLEIFAAPKPFIGDDAVNQIRAIESWVTLDPRPVVTLLGSGKGYAEVVKRFRLKWKPDIDTTFLGIPLFNSIVAAASASKADVAVIANADIMLFDDFHYAVRKVNRDISYPWMLIGARWDVSSVPEQPSKVRNDREKLSDRERLARTQHARENGTLHTYGGIDVWAWNTNTRAALYDGLMPHFVFGRGKYDNWFTHEVISAGHRHVIDASEACTFIHVLHDHHLVSDNVIGISANASRTLGDAESPERTKSRRAFWNQGSRAKFELYINTYLAAAHGSYTNQMGTVLHAPVKLQTCYESEGVCVFMRRRPHVCRCEHSPFVSLAQSDPFAINDSRLVFCGLLSSDSKIEYSSNGGTLARFVVSGRPRAYETPRSVDMSSGGKTRASQSSLHGALLEVIDSENQLPLSDNNAGAFGLPLVLEKLLEVVEHRTGNKRVIVTILNSNYKSLLPRFVCSARKAGVFDSLIIGALDDETYHYAVTRGFAVYLEETIFFNTNEEALAMRARFDSNNFPVLLSLRARVTRRLTRLGREVFYADPDVLLQSNPFHAVPDSSDIALLGISSTTTGANTPNAGVHASTAMLYARPGLNADKVLSTLGAPSSWVERVAGAMQGVTYSFLAVTQFQNIEGVLPAEGERKRAVALHLGVRGEAYRKIAVLNQARDLDIYNDLTEVCRFL